MRWVLGIVAALLLGACAGGVGGGPRAMPAAPAPESESEVILLGTLSREEVEAELPDWVAAQVEAEVDVEAATALVETGTGPEVTVFFGSWCSDSKRELARLWRAFDSGGGEPDFEISYIAVDRSKRRPESLVGDSEILYVPTFIVLEDGIELGRIIESAPAGIESDLLALVSGAAGGWISGRDDLPVAEAPEP